MKQTQRKAMDRDEIILFLRRFREKYHAKNSIIKIGIFGSAARDGMNDRSDIDVVVDLGRPDFFDLIGIKQALEEQLHYPVDIVRYRDNMNKYLKQRIDREAIYV
jgi:predicted nucleotidyltransferase